MTEGAAGTGGGSQGVGGGSRQVGGGSREVGGGSRQVGGGPREVDGGSRQVAAGPRELDGSPRDVGGSGEPTAADLRAAVRRRDRAKDEDWIRDYLRAAPYGFLATVGADGQPFLNSNLFVYDDHRRCIYLHTHRTGRTRDNLEALHKVAFSAASMGRLLPAPEALEFSVEYSGVVAFGTGRVVDDPGEARAALQMLLDKYAPHLEAGRDYRPTTVGELKRTAVYRVDIESWSGKQKEVEADFPGAYEPPRTAVPFPGRTEE